MRDENLTPKQRGQDLALTNKGLLAWYEADPATQATTVALAQDKLDQIREQTGELTTQPKAIQAFGDPEQSKSR